jgi:hypothetical protein
MRTLFYAMCSALAVGVALGEPRGRDGGGMGGGNNAGNVARGVDHGDANVGRTVDGAGDGRGANVNVDRNGANVQIDRGRDGANANVDRGRVGVDADRNRNVDRARLGDREFDRHNIGALDDSRFRGRNDNRWRYSRWHNQWWYWMPAGYWMVWNNDRWNRYDANTYVDNYSNQQPIASNASGPYYEDQNGFYYFEGNRKIYDPQIRRVANSVGRAESLEGASQR